MQQYQQETWPAQCTQADRVPPDEPDLGLAGKRRQANCQHMTRQPVYVHSRSSIYMAPGHSVFNLCQCIKVGMASPDEPDLVLANTVKPPVNSMTRQQLHIALDQCELSV
jgi:hypothetical protein